VYLSIQAYSSEGLPVENKTSRDFIPADETPAACIDRLQRQIAELERREQLLAEENAHLADLLREHGIAVRISSHLQRDLPPPVTEALAADSARFSEMTSAERRLYDQLFDGSDVFFIARTDTRLDVGGWLTKALVWVAATSDKLVLFAPGKRAHSERIPFRVLRESLYNHVTGTIALAPATEIATNQLKLMPAEAYQLLAQIYATGDPKC
jgi:hypothetical protein